ncbi:MAG: DUF2079 domain-containing protein [Candidatus Aenigmatarchaeota archaeon]
MEKKFIKKKVHFLPYFILFSMMVFYTTVLSIISINYYNRFYFSAFDLGIFDQGIWLLSRGEDPFVTVRGLHLFVDHIQFTTIFFAPLYWLWDDARVLLIAQSFVLSLGAIPLFLIGKEKLKNQFLPLFFVLIYFLYPALHYLNLENFHPVVLAVPFLFFAFYFLTKRKFLYYFAFVFLLLLTREELVLSILALGLYAFFFCDKKVGIVTIVLGFVWLFIIFNVIFPYYLGNYPHPNIKRGGDVLERTKNFLLNPIEILTLNTEENRQYIFELLFPIGFFPILHPQTSFLALPAIMLNLITTWPYAHSIRYHYTYAIIPFMFISLVYSFSFLKYFLKKKKFLFNTFLTTLLIFSLIGNIWIGPEVTSIKSGAIIEIIKRFGEFNEQEKARYMAISIIPKNATVSATYLFVPHLSHRKIIYMFPNPFKEAYWGLEFGNFTPPPLKDVDYILLDDTPNEFEKKEIINKLLENGTYSKIFEKENIYILKRMQ